MNALPRAKGAKPRPVPPFLATARALYGEAFEARTPEDVGEAMAEWQELSDGERSFTLGHLLYLNLRAQAAQLHALRDLRKLLVRADEALDTLVEQGEGEEDDGSELPESLDPTGDDEPEEPQAFPALDREALARATADAEALAEAEEAAGQQHTDLEDEGADDDAPADAPTSHEETHDAR